MVVGEHGIQTFKVVIVVCLTFMLSFDFLSPQVHIPLLDLDNWFVHIYLYIYFEGFVNINDIVVDSS